MVEDEPLALCSSNHSPAAAATTASPPPKRPPTRPAGKKRPLTFVHPLRHALLLADRARVERVDGGIAVPVGAGEAGCRVRRG
jgi:hypothetical protein